MTPVTLAGHTYFVDGGRVRDIRVRVKADPGLIGEMEAQAVVYALAGALGCLLGYWVSLALGVLR